VFPAEVAVTEITGSESFVHIKRAQTDWVAVRAGVHEFLPGEKIEVALDPGDMFVFDAGRLVAAPGAA
jgi:glycerol transport system ATP-binding protein